MRAEAALLAGSQGLEDRRLRCRRSSLGLSGNPSFEADQIDWPSTY